MAANLVQQDWGNDQPLLWTNTLESSVLTQAQQQVICPADTILVTDAYIQTNVGNGQVFNKIIFDVGRSEWASYPNPFIQAPPTTFWFDRTVPPSINLYPVPDGNGPYTLFYYRFRRTEDAKVAAQLELPTRWLMAFADAVALELSYTYAPDKSVTLMQKLNGPMGSYTRARLAEREDVAIYIAPGLASYYGR